LKTGPAIGLFGGSFNPAHAGHRHVADAGLRELALDQVWWLVSPQNPLKPAQPSASMRARTVDALGLPRAMRVSHVESELGTHYTVDLLRALTRRHPNTRFVYLIGSDNLAQMPLWKEWREIVSLVPIAVIARPGEPVRARLGRVARHFADHRIAEHQAHTLKDRSPPAWTYLTLPMSALSSSAIRAKGTADPT
jgi:nicotinate-nucleotide adenylyltransferase